MVIINDSNSKIVITNDGRWPRGSPLFEWLKYSLFPERMKKNDVIESWMQKNNNESIKT